MGSEIDTFDDILPEPAVSHARAGGRFQPKAKAQPRRETSASLPSTLPDGIKDKLVTPASNDLEAEQSLQPIVANNVLRDSAVSSFPASEVVGTEEPLKGNEVSFSDDVGYMDALRSDNVISDGNCDSHSNFGKSTGEDDTLGFDITSFDDILPEPVTAKPGGKFLPKAKPHPSKNQSVPITSVLLNAMKEQPIRQASTGSEETESVKPVDVAYNKLTDPKLTDPVDPSLTSLGIAVTGKEACSRNALNEEVEISGSTDNWHSSFEKSEGKVDSTGFNLEPFGDILPKPVTGNARAGGKYQPKAKPWPGKGTFAPVSSASPNFTLEKPITPTPTVSNKAQCVQSFVADNTLTDVVGLSLTASKILKEPMGNNYSGVSFSGDHRSSKLVDPSQLVAVNTLHSEVAASDGSGYWHPSFGKSAGKNADIFSGSDCCDNCLTQSTSGAVSATSKPFHKVDMDAQPGNKSLTSCSVDRDGESSLSPSEVPNLDALNNKDSELNSSCDAAEDHTCPDYCMTQDSVTRGETAVSNNDFQIGNRRLETEFQEGGAFPDLETPDIMSEATIASGRRTSKFLPKHKVKVKSSDLRPNAVESTICFPDAQLAASEAECMNEGSIPAFPPDKDLNKASVGFSDSIPPDHTSELRVNEETRNIAETSPSNAAVSDDVNPEAVAGTSGEVGAKSRKRKTNNVSDLSSKAKKSSAALEENEGGKSSRRRRKRVGAPQLVDEPVDEANDDAVGIPAEAPGASVLDEDGHDDEYTLQGSSHQKKRAPRKSKKTVTETEKSARKRKKASEAPDNSTKEAPKKFSHSTQRMKRCVNKVLLNTPEDEIDYRKLPIKDLILFAGFKERLAIKEAKTSKMPLTNQSAANSFPGEASHGEDENLDSAQGRDSANDQAAPMSQLEYSYFNYQSYMDKTPIARWSKQDTELFYEAVRQFGTDFSMIQQLFPGRTRHQVKLKFKKEERQHPLRLAEAVKNRAKDHSHFESVIERLKQAAAQEEQDNVEDSIDQTGKVGEEVTQIDEEAAQPKQERGKSERDEEVAGEDLERKGEEDVEAGAPADVSHLKSDDSEEDEADMWSQYKSEY